MFCSKCGTEMPDGSNFCLKCGMKLATQQVKQAVEDERQVDNPEIEILKTGKRIGGLIALVGGLFGVILIIVVLVVVKVWIDDIPVKNGQYVAFSDFKNISKYFIYLGLASLAAGIWAGCFVTIAIQNLLRK